MEASEIFTVQLSLGQRGVQAVDVLVARDTPGLLLVKKTNTNQRDRSAVRTYI